MMKVKNDVSYYIDSKRRYLTTAWYDYGNIHFVTTFIITK